MILAQNAQIEKLTPEKLKVILDDLKNQDVIFDRIFFVDPFGYTMKMSSVAKMMENHKNDEPRHRSKRKRTRQ